MSGSEERRGVKLQPFQSVPRSEYGCRGLLRNVQKLVSVTQYMGRNLFFLYSASFISDFTLRPVQK